MATNLQTTEAVRIELWRQAVLEQAGVNPTVARVLSECPGDLHRMLEAHDRGCTDNQLLRIFV